MPAEAKIYILSIGYKQEPKSHKVLLTIQIQKITQHMNYHKNLNSYEEKKLTNANDKATHIFELSDKVFKAAIIMVFRHKIINILKPI